MAVTREQRRALHAALTSTLALVDTSRLSASISAGDRADAERTADTLFSTCGGESLVLVRLAFAAELLGTIAVDLAADRDEARRLVTRLQADGELPRAALGREVLHSGRMFELPELTLDVILTLILVFADGEAISLSTTDEDGRMAVACRIGDPGAVGRTARFETLARPPSVVKIVGLGRDGAAARLLVMAATPLLGCHHPQSVTPRDAAGAVERRLARLRFDLHDGPQQDIHLLGQDLRLFRDQLRPMIAGASDENRVLGRLDDLEAQLVALDEELRRLATSVASPFLAPASLPDALHQLTDAFAERTGVVPQTRVQGSVDSLTDSQQIALLSLIREALSNIRQHSDARMVQITVEAGSGGVGVEVTDDGTGFDPESTLVRAARAGRLGLAGMHERVRMLGGSTKIRSRPGGPTVVSAILPPWSAD